MVPLTTLQGLPAAQLATRARGRPLLVWGVGDLAQDVVVSLTKAGLAPEALLHDDPAVEVPWAGHPPVRRAGRVLEEAAAGPRPFIVLAAAAWRHQAEAACRAAGLAPGVDYVSHLAIPRPRAIVDLAPGGWLHPPLDGEGQAGPGSGGAPMGGAEFSRLLARLAADLPLLSHLELALWGDPLLHPELPDLIRRAQAVAPCTVPTRLAGTAPLAALVRAAPSRVDVLVHGYGEQHRPMPGGHPWPDFLARLDELAASLDGVPRRPRTRLVYFPRRGDPPGAGEGLRRRLAGTAITLAVEHPYPMPYELPLARCETGEYPAVARRLVADLPWDPDRALALARADAGLPCLSQRVFPVIRGDRSVALCHLYREPTVAGDYLATGWPALLEARHRHPHCRRCQRHGLHRLDLDVLDRRHPRAASDLERVHEHA